LERAGIKTPKHKLRDRWSWIQGSLVLLIALILLFLVVAPTARAGHYATWSAAHSAIWSRTDPLPFQILQPAPVQAAVHLSVLSTPQTGELP